jgi:predicted amidophosphoribosyltransferase
MNTPKTKGICLQCQAEFEGNKGKKYCSERCRTNFHNEVKRQQWKAYKWDKQRKMNELIDILARSSPLFNLLNHARTRS